MPDDHQVDQTAADMYKAYARSHEGSGVSASPTREFVTSQQLDEAAAAHGGEVFGRSTEQRHPSPSAQRGVQWRENMGTGHRQVAEHPYQRHVTRIIPPVTSTVETAADMYKAYARSHEGSGVSASPAREFVTSEQLDEAAAAHGGEVFGRSSQDQADNERAQQLQAGSAPLNDSVNHSKELDKAMARAKKKFQQIDLDGNGMLEGPELVALAQWVWSSFHPNGESLTPQQKQQEGAKLLSRLDQNKDGVMSFEEFSEWFKKTCKSIERYRSGFAAKQKAGAVFTSSPTSSHSRRHRSPSPERQAKPVQSIVQADEGNDSNTLSTIEQHDRTTSDTKGSSASSVDQQGTQEVTSGRSQSPGWFARAPKSSHRRRNQSQSPKHVAIQSLPDATKTAEQRHPSPSAQRGAQWRENMATGHREAAEHPVTRNIDLVISPMASPPQTAADMYKAYARSHEGSGVSASPAREFVTSEQLDEAAAAHGGEVFGRSSQDQADNERAQQLQVGSPPPSSHESKWYSNVDELANREAISRVHGSPGRRSPSPSKNRGSRWRENFRADQLEVSEHPWDRDMERVLNHSPPKERPIDTSKHEEDSTPVSPGIPTATSQDGENSPQTLMKQVQALKGGVFVDAFARGSIPTTEELSFFVQLHKLQKTDPSGWRELVEAVSKKASEPDELDKAMARAKKKFQQIDLDGNGMLEGPELVALAQWVWSSFHPNGESLTPQQKQQEGAKLLSRLDQNKDGVMSFEEFSEWFKKTCKSIERYRSGFAAKQKAGAVFTSSPTSSHSRRHRSPSPERQTKPVQSIVQADGNKGSRCWSNSRKAYMDETGDNEWVQRRMDNWSDSSSTAQDNNTTSSAVGNEVRQMTQREAPSNEKQELDRLAAAEQRKVAAEERKVAAEERKAAAEERSKSPARLTVEQRQAAEDRNAAAWSTAGANSPTVAEKAKASADEQGLKKLEVEQVSDRYEKQLEDEKQAAEARRIARFEAKQAAAKKAAEDEKTAAEEKRLASMKHAAPERAISPSRQTAEQKQAAEDRQAAAWSSTGAKSSTSHSNLGDSYKLERLNREFDAMDSNKDGVVDRAEYIAAMSSRTDKEKTPSMRAGWSPSRQAYMDSAKLPGSKSMRSPSVDEMDKWAQARREHHDDVKKAKASADEQGLKKLEVEQVSDRYEKQLEDEKQAAEARRIARFEAKKQAAAKKAAEDEKTAAEEKRLASMKHAAPERAISPSRQTAEQKQAAEDRQAAAWSSTGAKSPSVEEVDKRAQARQERHDNVRMAKAVTDQQGFMSLRSEQKQIEEEQKLLEARKASRTSPSERRQVRAAEGKQLREKDGVLERTQSPTRDSSKKQDAGKAAEDKMAASWTHENPRRSPKRDKEWLAAERKAVREEFYRKEVERKRQFQSKLDSS